MNRERLLNEVKKELVREFKNNSHSLEKVVPYYILIQNENHPLLLELIEETNNKKFYINYRYDKEDYYTFGTMSIHFGLTPEQACGIEEYDEEDFPDRYLQKDETYFEIDLEWYEHGSTDEYIPRIIIRKCTESKFIDCYENTLEEYKKWYSELEELQKKDKESRKKYIGEEIKRLMKEKKKL
jgi:hypothetical protein